MSKATGLLFGGSQQQSSSTPGFQAAPPFAQDAEQQLINRGVDVSNQTTPFAPVPFNQYQTGALQALGNYTGGYQPFNFNTQGAEDQYNRPAFGYTQGAQTAFGGAQNAFNQAGNQVQLANANIAQGVNPLSSKEISGSINDFMNPFTEQALDPTIRDINRQSALQQSNIGSLANNANAFGSTRQALLESENNRNTAQQVADTTGTMYNNAFTNASQLGLNRLQNERSNFLQGAGLNLNGANAYNSMGQGLTGLGSANLAGRQENFDEAQAKAGTYLAGKGLGAQINTNNLNNGITANNAAYGAGSAYQNQQQQTNQIPIAQLQFLQQLLSPNGFPWQQSQQGSQSSQTSPFANSGSTAFTGSILNSLGSFL